MLRVSFALALLACSSPGKAPKTSTITSEPTVAIAGDATCPLLVPGTTLSVEDAADGTALVFVTTGDVAAVRQRAAALAEMNNSRQGPPDAFGLMLSTKATATAADIDGGARVTYRATEAGDTGKLGDELRMHGGHLAGASSCEMH
ncbi:MAG: hypothetical protein SFX73_35400 [Kofleriaceae bacterium]|nr:hypothetical protein [Kofleriaceae bacterium]